MQIKKVNRKTGEITLFTPGELVDAAILYAVKTKNTLDKVWLIKAGTVALTAPLHHIAVTDPKKPKDLPGFSAIAKGTVELGYTDTKTHKYYEPKKYAFVVHYESAKDGLGLPDIHVAEAHFKLMAHPSERMKFEDMTMKIEKPKNTPAQRLQVALGKAEPEKVAAEKPPLPQAKK